MVQIESQLKLLGLRGRLRLTVFVLLLGTYMVLFVSISTRVNQLVLLEKNLNEHEERLERFLEKRRTATEVLLRDSIQIGKGDHESETILRDFPKGPRPLSDPSEYSTSLLTEDSYSTQLKSSNEENTRELKEKKPRKTIKKQKTLRSGSRTKNKRTSVSTEDNGSNTDLHGEPVLPPPRDHPHAGARYPNGTWGYVADVTYARRKMIKRYWREHNKTRSDDLPDRDYLAFTSNRERDGVCNASKQQDVSWAALQRVVVDGRETAPTAGVSGLKRMGQSTNFSSHRKILCAVYTYEKNHDRVEGIVGTWGWRCDGFFAASTKTVLPHDSNKLAAGAIVDLPHEGKEEYGNMWQKTRSILSYMFDNFLEDYDYFYLAGDVTHLIVENLRRYIEQVEMETMANATSLPLYMGMRVHYRKTTFHHGGAGYILNREALRRVVTVGFDPREKLCDVHARTSAEDRMMGKCCSRLGIPAVDTTDSHGRQRFHAMDPAFVENFAGVDKETSTNKGSSKPASRVDHWWHTAYEYWAMENKVPGWKAGLDLISEQSLAFHHLTTKTQMKRHHALLYRHSCPEGSAVGDLKRKSS
jgi:hypothetical protein